MQMEDLWSARMLNPLVVEHKDIDNSHVVPPFTKATRHGPRRQCRTAIASAAVQFPPANALNQAKLEPILGRGSTDPKRANNRVQSLRGRLGIVSNSGSSGTRPLKFFGLPAVHFESSNTRM